MGYLRTRPLPRTAKMIRSGKRRAMSGLGDYNSCLSTCDTNLTNDTNNNDPDASSNYDSCTSGCTTQYPQGEVANSNPAPGTTGTGTTGTTGTTGGGGQSTTGSIISAIGTAGGGLLSGLFSKPTIVTTGGLDPTTLLLIGGGILAVVMFTKKRD